MRKVIIDCDPGVDDAHALLFALSPLSRPLIDVIAVTITHGNLSTPVRLGRNARRVLEVANRSEIPVYLGAAQPIVRPTHGGAPFVHGEDGLGDVGETEGHDHPFPQKSAAQAIGELCLASPGEITVVLLGPMTNMALALALYPELGRDGVVREVVAMGGAFFVPGNISPLGEANVVNDPEAAHAALGAFSNFTLAPLDVCAHVVISPRDLETISAKGNKVGSFVGSITAFYLRFFEDVMKRKDGFLVHDSICILWLVRPDLFAHTMAAVDVETAGKFTLGQTVADLRGTTENAQLDRIKNVRILMKVNHPRQAIDHIIEAFHAFV